MAEETLNDGTPPEPTGDTGPAGTTPEPPTGDAPGANEPKGGEPKAFTQEQLNKHVGEARTSERKKAAAEIEARVEGEKGRLRKEAENAKLLEDQNYQELAARSAQEAEEAKAQLAAYEHAKEVSALLDKKAGEGFALLKEPAARELFGKIQGELSDVASAADSLESVFKAAVQAEVDKRLDTGKPPPSGADAPEPKQFGDMTPEEWAEEKKRRKIRT